MYIANPFEHAPSARSSYLLVLPQGPQGARHQLVQHRHAVENEMLMEATRKAWRSVVDSVATPLTDEDIRIHAWLNSRLAKLDYERHGLWPRVRRFFLSLGTPRGWRS